MPNQSLTNHLLKCISIVHILEVFGEHIVIECTLFNNRVDIERLRELPIKVLNGEHHFVGELHEKVQGVGFEAGTQILSPFFARVISIEIAYYGLSDNAPVFQRFIEEIV